MEENKEKKPYNKKRHYYNNRNRKREKPAEEPAPVVDAAPKTEFELEIEALIQERKDAKKAKNFARADEIRNYLKEKGVTLIDTPQGTTYTVS